MDEDGAIHDVDLLIDGHDLSPLDDMEPNAPEEEGKEEGEEEDGGEGGSQESKVPVQISYKQKLVEILKKLSSPELQIYSEASKEFIDSLKKDSGAEILCEYVRSSPKCVELAEAWRLHCGKPGMSHILSLVSAILDHPGGKTRSSQSAGVARSLDGFARSIMESKLNDLYTELESQEIRRQSAALRLLACVVRRGLSLASEVTRSFDFKLAAVSKLSVVRKNKVGKEMSRSGKPSARRAYVEFAVSFLEVGNPRLLRWILQQREMYSGVLRGLGSDDVETVVHVLATLRDRVLTAESLIPPGLRSVLFGSVALEQLIYISGNPMVGPAADIAHEVLVMVCTDPSNGLMPGPNLKGNEKRLFELLKKLKATEVRYHKDLLLAIVSRRASLCSAYMDEFPYHLEPRSSSLWFASISVAADIISSMDANTLGDSFLSRSRNLPDVNNDEIQDLLKCIIPRAFTRSVINKGLLHSDILVKNGSLRVLLESLKSLERLLSVIDKMVESMSVKPVVDTSGEGIAILHGLPRYSCFRDMGRFLDTDGISAPDADRSQKEKMISLKQYIQDGIRAALPDPQVLLKLLSSSSNSSLKHPGTTLKRCAQLPEFGLKKLKSSTTNENVDIVISGIVSGMNAEHTDDTLEDWKEDQGAIIKEELAMEKNHATTVAEIWGLNEQTRNAIDEKDAESFFHSRLLDVLTLYLRTMPIALDGSFDFFKILPYNPLSLSIDKQLSLLSLLVEYIGQSPGSRTSARVPDLMYRHLQPLIYVLLFSQNESVRHQAYVLARTAMISTGAFDENLAEIDAWFFFLPGYNRKIHSAGNQEAEVFHDLSTIILSFLCDAVSTVGNNLYKYLDTVRILISELDGIKDHSPGFSPLIICILQKCLRLLGSDSGAFKLYEKSIISSYVCNTISLILQTQIDMAMLPGLIHLVLSEHFKNFSLANEDSDGLLCEWRPLKNLFSFVSDILHKRGCSLCFIPANINGGQSSLLSVLTEVKDFLGQHHGGELVGLATALLSSVICAMPNDILKNFPQLITVAAILFGSHFQFLPLVLFPDDKFLANIAYLWPHIFSSAMEMIENTVSDNCQGNDNLSCNKAIHLTGKLVSADNLDHTESAAAAFRIFLRHTPFYMLFAAVLSFRGNTMDSSKVLDISHLTKLLDLLRLSILECSVNDSILFLRHVLFWSYQILLSYMAKPSNELEELFDLCFTFTEYIFQHLLAMITDTTGSKRIGASSITSILEAVDLIFQHPVVTLSLSHPLNCCKKLADESLGDSVEAFLTKSKQVFHPMNHCILQFLGKVMDILLGSSNVLSYASESHGAFLELVVKAFMHLMNRMILLFRENFELCATMRDLGPLLPSFNVFQVLMRFMSPFELLGLVHWMSCKLEDNSSGSKCSYFSVVSVILYIADGALDMLYSYLRQSNMKSSSYLLWDLEVKSFDATILQEVYCRILDYAISFNLAYADLCLSKSVKAAYDLRSTKSHPALLQFHMLVSRMVINCPMKMLVHCLYPTSKIKAKTLVQLIEVSPVHLSLFGKIFLGIISKDLSLVDALSLDGACPLKAEFASKDFNHVLSEDDFVLLLPAALSFLTSNLDKLQKKGLKIFRMIPVFYSRILLDNFSNWKAYISRNFFLEEFDELEPISLDGFHNLFCNSLLGKAIKMLHYFFLSSGSSLKKRQRLKVFNSIYSHSSISTELLDSELKRIDASSYKESLKLANEVAAKISFTRLLLFPPEVPNHFVVMDVDKGSEEIPAKKESDRLNSAKLRFMNILVNSLDQIVKKFPLKLDNSKISCTASSYYVFRFLEHLILRNIVQLSREIQGYVTQLSSIVFLNPFIKSSLLHRFEDPIRLKAIRCILITLSDGRFSSAEILELLLGHSQFVPTILYNDSSALTCTGTLLQAVPSILNSVEVFPTDGSLMNGRSTCDAPSKLRYKRCALDDRKLELIKLLRVLYHLKDKQHSCASANTNSRELLSLLLSGYGATMSHTDLEILHLMHEIESIEASEIIAELDYLWGDSALKLRNEQISERLSPSDKTDDSETIEGRRKRLFKENIPVDSKLCAMTVLHFCSDRTSMAAPISLKRLLRDNSVDNEEMWYPNIDIVQQYDPAFILRFSIHSLLMGYIEPIEFARIGLLAITLISISSADVNIRRLGYESLGCFKKALENCRNSKDVLQLKLLLTYLQNGIAEAWQKIPSVTAIFAAEACWILLDPSRNHFLPISKLLLHSPKVNLKAIPLFQTLFQSGSIHFKRDRMWILQLLHAGLNSSEDAKLYKRNNPFELLLSFYASSFSDPESEILILRIIKKSVRLHALAHYLVKEFGLLPWLSTVISFHGERLGGARKEFSLKIMEMSLEVINDVISLRMITEWLQDCAFEQLSELSSYLHKLLVHNLKLLKESVSLVNSILSVMGSTLRISQKRKIFEPHFTISLQGLCQLCQAIDNEFSCTQCSLTLELGINAILMSAPLPVVSLMDRAMLLRLVVWAIPVALQSTCNSNKDPDPDMILPLEERKREELLISKILRWLTASIILGSILEKNPSSLSSGTKILQSLLENLIKEEDKSRNIDFSVIEELAALILYLQQLLGRNCINFASVISALCLLLLPILPTTVAGKGFLEANHDLITSLCSRIRCPSEANPAWRWSYYQPWKDLSLNLTEVERMEEQHACQSLLIIFSDALGGKPLGLPTLLHQDVQRIGLFEWQRNIILGAGTQSEEG